MPEPSTASQLPAVNPAQLTITRLPNGLTVAVQRDERFPLASLRLYVHAGSAYEKPGQAGISHQLEHMVFKGTVKRPKGAVATDIEGVGGYLNAATSFDYTVYITDMPAEQWQLGMDVLHDMAFNPSLDPKELESEKQVVLAELQRGQDSPGSRLFQRIQATTLKGTPYERPIIGFTETIQNFSVDGIKDYIASLYHPQSMLLLVVGNVDPDAVLAEADRVFGGLKNTAASHPQTPIDIMTLPQQGPLVSMEETPWNKVHLAVAFPSFDQNDPRSATLDMLAQLLAGDETSFLYHKYKYEKRLVDSIHAANYGFERLGLFYFAVSLAPENLAPFWEEFTKDLANLSTHSFTPEQLDRAKLAIEDGLFRQKETLPGLTSKLGDFLFFTNSPNSESYYLQQMRSTQTSMLQSAARDIFTLPRASVVALVPTTPTTPAQADQPPAAKGNATDTQQSTQRLPDAAWLKNTLSQAFPAGADEKTSAAAAVQGKEEILPLGNGRTLILLPDHTLPYAALDLTFTGSETLLSPREQGLATLTAAVLTKGTASKNAPQLEVFQADRAAAINASSGRHTFSVSMRYPARFSGDMFGLLHEVLTQATLPDEEISRAKQYQQAAIVSRDDQPIGLAFSRLYPMLFGQHPYGYQQLGDKENIRAFTRDQVLSFWKRQSAQPWVMAVSGVFDRDAVIAAAKALPAPSDATPAIKAPGWGKTKELTVDFPQREQAHLFMVFPSVSATSPDKPAMDLLQTILAGQSGLLFRELRDKQGLGYTVTALQWQAQQTGATILYIGTEPGKVQQAEEGFRTIVQQLHTTLLPEEEILRGKNKLAGEYAWGHQSLGSRSSEAAVLAAQGQPVTAARDAIATAKNLTAEDLRTVARRYLNLDKAYIMKVLP